MASIWFLLATFSLCWTSTYSAELASPKTDSRYGSTLQAAIDIFWETFQTEIRDKNNALVFTVLLAADMTFIGNTMGDETKKEVKKTLPLYERFGEDLRAVDEDITQASLREMRFKTIFYGQIKADIKKVLDRFIPSKIVVPNDRFFIISKNCNDKSKLVEQIENSSIGITCEVRYCPIRAILSCKPSFAILTLATWNITSVEGMHRGFQWITTVPFALSDTSSIQVSAMRGYGTYDYAEFVYPRLNGCTGRVLRLLYKTSFNLTFVIPSDEKMCSSSEDLWKNVQHVNLNWLNYERRTMFLSLPLFKVSANIDLKMKLKATALARGFDQESSGLYNALAFQAAEVIFNPEVFHKNWPIPSFGKDQFRAERPFFFALFHSTSQAPIFAGLINNPGCTSKCDKIKIAGG